MTVPLSAGSPRAVHALRFGAELKRAMTARKASTHRLAAASGCGRSAIANWRCGGNLPRVDTATRLAEALHWPRLVDIASAGRSRPCARCGRVISTEGSGAKRFCGPSCREVDQQLRSPGPAHDLAGSVRAELDRVAGTRGHMSRTAVAAALESYSLRGSKRVRRSDKLAAHASQLASAIDAMCRSCEPEGACAQPECALRAFSPLPMRGRPTGLLEARREPTAAEAAVTAEKRRVAMVRRWEDPEARERQSAQNSARWASKSDQERQEIGMRISAGRRAAAS